MEITRGAEPHHVLPILCGIGGRHGEDQCVATSRAFSHVLQDLAALLPGQIDVENNQIGRGPCIVAVHGVEKPHSLLSVVHYLEVGTDVGSFYRCSDEKHIRGVVFDNEDVPALAGFLLRRAA